MRKFYLSFFFYFLACQNSTQKTSDLKQLKTSQIQFSILSAQAQCIAPENIWDDSNKVCKVNIPLLSDAESCSAESGTWVNAKCYKQNNIVDPNSALCQYSDAANVWDSDSKLCYKPPIFASDKNSCEKENGVWEDNVCYTKIIVSPYTSEQCLSINENNKFLDNICYQPIGIIDSDATCVKAGGKWFTIETSSSCYKIVDIEKSLAQLCTDQDSTNIFQDNQCYGLKPLLKNFSDCNSDSKNIWNNTLSKCLVEIALVNPDQVTCLKTTGNSWNGTECLTQLTMATDSDSCSTQGGTWKTNTCFSVVQQVAMTQDQCRELGSSYKWLEDQSGCFQVINIVDPKANDSKSTDSLRYSDNSAACRGMSTVLKPLWWDDTTNQCFSSAPIVDVSTNNSDAAATRYDNDKILCGILDSDSTPALWVDEEHKCYTGLIISAAMMGSATAETTQNVCKAQNSANVFVKNSSVTIPQLGSCYAPITLRPLDNSSCVVASGKWLTVGSPASQGCYRAPDNITTQAICESIGAGGKWITSADGTSKCYSQSSITNMPAVCQNFNGKSVFGVIYPGVFSYDLASNSCLYQPYIIPDPLPLEVNYSVGPLTYAACPLGKTVVGYKEGAPKDAIQCDDFNKIQLAASRFNTCAIVQGKYYCWGRTDFVGTAGVAGALTAERATKPQLVKVQQTWKADPTVSPPVSPPVGSTLYSMAMGRWSSCLIFNGQTHCSGKAFMGISATDSLGSRYFLNAGGYSVFIKKTASYDVTSCQIGSSSTTSPANSLGCWGDNHFEQSGIPTLELKCFAESSSNSNYVLFPSIDNSNLTPVCVTPGSESGNIETFADNYSTLSPTLTLPNTTSFKESFDASGPQIRGVVKHTWDLKTVADICSSSFSTAATTEFGTDGLTSATEDTSCYKKFVDRSGDGSNGVGGYSNPGIKPSAPVTSAGVLTFGPNYSTISPGEAETPISKYGSTGVTTERPWWWSYHGKTDPTPSSSPNWNLNNIYTVSLTLPAGQEFIDVAVGSHHVCAVVKIGVRSDSNPTPYEIQCRGKMSPMGLASAGSTAAINVVQGSKLFTSKLTKTIALAAAPKQLILGNDVTCYIDSNDKLWCAGGGNDYFKSHAFGYVNLSDSSTNSAASDNAGFLLNPTSADKTSTKIAGFGPVQKVAIGQQFICALTKEYTSPTAQPNGNKLKCVGKAASHPYAYSVLSSTQITTPATALSQIQDFTSQVYPTLIAGQPNPTLVDIAAGTFHACVADQSQVYCWGKNDWNQLGTSVVTGIATPGLDPASADTAPPSSGGLPPVAF